MSNPTTDEVRGAANAMFAAAQAEAQQPPQPSPEQIQAHMARQAAAQRHAAAQQQTVANAPQGAPQQPQRTVAAPQPGDPNYPAYADAQGWARHLTPEEAAYADAQRQPPRTRAEYAAAQQQATAQRRTPSQRQQRGQQDNWQGAARQRMQQTYRQARTAIHTAQDPITRGEIYGRIARSWWDALLLVIVGSVGLVLLAQVWRVGAQATYDMFRDFGAEGWLDKNWLWLLYAIPIFISGFQWVYVPPLRDPAKIFRFWPITLVWIIFFLIDTGSTDRTISRFLLGKSISVMPFGEITFADRSILYNATRFLFATAIALGVEIILRMLIAQTLRGWSFFVENDEEGAR